MKSETEIQLKEAEALLNRIRIELEEVTPPMDYTVTQAETARNAMKGIASDIEDYQFSKKYPEDVIDPTGPLKSVPAGDATCWHLHGRDERLRRLSEPLSFKSVNLLASEDDL